MASLLRARGWWRSLTLLPCLFGKVTAGSTVRRLAAALFAGACALFGMMSARAADDIAPSQSPSVADPAAVDRPGESLSSVSAFFSGWSERAADARETQPHWASPLVTTTGLLEQRLRFDFSRQHSSNGTDTSVLDGGRGLDLIVSETNEIQVAAAPYDIRTSANGKGALSGFADWPFFRVKQRLASSPESEGNYLLTAWLQLQAPSGIAALTNHAWTFLPTLAFGKGWGNFDIQGTVGGVLPASHTATLGDQIVTNVAFQYRFFDVFSPELEVNWTHFLGGQRSGLNQVFLTSGLVIGRLPITDVVHLTLGFGYQSAVAPSFRAKPLTPSADHAWLFTSRFNF